MTEAALDARAVIPALKRDEAVLAFLATRRSRAAKTLAAPGPDRAALAEILTLAARCPDHGKLEPWRFVVADSTHHPRLQEIARARATARGLAGAEIDKTAQAFGLGPVIVAVLVSPVPSEKIPGWEQESSAAALCLSLVNAAQAAGWGANWLTGKLARDPDFLAEALGARPGETAAGFIHIGTETVTPPDRPRPDIEALTTWL